MSSIFKYLPHIIIILLLGFFIFGILKGCQNMQSPGDANTTAINNGNSTSALEEENPEEASLEDLFEEDIDETDGNSNDENEKLTGNNEKEKGENENDTTPPPSSSSSADEMPSGTSGMGKYLVVVGSYTTESYAKTELARLKKLGYQDAELFEFDLSQYFSLTTGRYNSLSEARAVKRKVDNDPRIEEAYVHMMRGKKVSRNQ